MTAEEKREIRRVLHYELLREIQETELLWGCETRPENMDEIEAYAKRVAARLL